MRYVSVVRHSEWLSSGYFLYLVVAACARRMPVVRRASLVAAAGVMAVLVVAIARAGAGRLRDWAPLLYVLAGYYASGLLFVRPSEPLEAWLIGWDRRWLGDPTARFAAWPRWLLAYLDIVYMGCFLLLPAGFAVLSWNGHDALTDRYWTMVLGAEFGAFAPLAFVETRPPWAVERPAAATALTVRRTAEHFVRRLSIGVNTFPSGHVAGSLAVALAVMAAMPWTGTALLVIAVTISLACVVGRYHYIVDVIAGAALGIIVWAAVAGGM